MPFKIDVHIDFYIYFLFPWDLCTEGPRQLEQQCVTHDGDISLVCIHYRGPESETLFSIAAKNSDLSE